MEDLYVITHNLSTVRSKHELTDTSMLRRHRTDEQVERSIIHVYAAAVHNFTYSSLDETTVRSTVVVSSGVASHNAAIRHYEDVPSASLGIHI